MSKYQNTLKYKKNTKQKIRELVELNKQNVATQAKKAEELTANLVVYNEAIKKIKQEKLMKNG